MDRIVVAAGANLKMGSPDAYTATNDGVCASAAGTAASFALDRFLPLTRCRYVDSASALRLRGEAAERVMAHIA